MDAQSSVRVEAKGDAIDNYVAVFPGEKRLIKVTFPKSEDAGTPAVAFEGWNVPDGRSQ
jgi:hypothetical protein